jgi:hypothetical protein
VWGLVVVGTRVFRPGPLAVSMARVCIERLGVGDLYSMSLRCEFGSLCLTHDRERVLGRMLGSNVVMVVCVFIEDLRGPPLDWLVVVFSWPMVCSALINFVSGLVRFITTLF